MDAEQHLLSNIEALDSELENKKQRCHLYKRDLQLLHALEEDYLLEIEALKSNKQEANLKNTLKQLEEHVSSNRHINDDAEIIKKKEYINNLLVKIDELKITTNSAKEKNIKNLKLHEENKLVLNENIALKSEIEILRNEIAEIQSALECLTIENDNINEYIKNTTKEVSETREILEAKLQQLNEIQEKCSKSQENLVNIKLKLENAKCRPLDSDKRGNSLFAEVEDSRIKMQQQISKMQHHYDGIKRDLLKKLHFKTVLLKETIKLSGDIKVTENCTPESTTLAMYKSKTKGSEILIKQYKEELLKPVKFNGNGAPKCLIDYANSKYPKIWLEISASKDQLLTYSKRVIDICMEVLNANKEKFNQQLIVLQLKAKIEELKHIKLEVQLQSEFSEIDLTSNSSYRTSTSSINRRESVRTFDVLSVIPETEVLQEYTTKRDEENYNSIKLNFISIDKQASVSKWIQDANNISTNDTIQSSQIIENDDTTSLTNYSLHTDLNSVDGEIYDEAIQVPSNQFLKESFISDECSHLFNPNSLDLPSILTKSHMSSSFTQQNQSDSVCNGIFFPDNSPSKFQKVNLQDLDKFASIPIIEENLNSIQMNISNSENIDRSSPLTCDLNTESALPLLDHNKNNDNACGLQEDIPEFDNDTQLITSNCENMNKSSQNTCGNFENVLTLINHNENSDDKCSLKDNITFSPENRFNASVSLNENKTVISPSIENDSVYDTTINSDIIVEEVNVSCITIESSSSDNLQDDLGLEKLETEDSVVTNTFSHCDSFQIESKWKKTRKITSTTDEIAAKIQPKLKVCNKENSLPDNYRTPLDVKKSHLTYGTLRKPLSEKASTIKQGVVKPSSVEKRWKY